MSVYRPNQYPGSDAGHICDDDLERYALGTVKDEAELATLEEHFPVCGQCIERAEKKEGYVETMRAALRRLHVVGHQET